MDPNEPTLPKQILKFLGPRLSGNQPPTQRPRWMLMAIISAGTILTLLVGLLIGLLIASHGGTATASVSIAAQQTASASAQFTGTSAPSTGVTPTGLATKAPTALPRTPTPTVLTKPPSVERMIATGTISSGVPVVAHCPSDELALSGGWYISNGGSPEVGDSLRNANGWAVFAYGAAGTSISVYVLCLQNEPGATVVERQETFPYLPDETAPFTANCNPGEVAVGAGFGNPGLDIYTFAPPTSNGWTIIAHNASTSSTPVTLYLECLKAPKAVTKRITATSQVAAQGTGGAQPSCPAGSLLSGGGFSHDAARVILFDSHPQSATWETYVSNADNTFSVQLTGYAVCLSFTV